MNYIYFLLILYLLQISYCMFSFASSSISMIICVSYSYTNRSMHKICSNRKLHPVNELYRLWAPSMALFIYFTSDVEMYRNHSKSDHWILLVWRFMEAKRVGMQSQTDILSNHVQWYEPSNSNERIDCGGWRATENCDYRSKRLPSKDLACDDVVPPNNSGIFHYTIQSFFSGYCLCSGGRRTGYSDCGHRQFTCRELCASLPQRDCPRVQSNQYLQITTKLNCNTELSIDNQVFSFFLSNCE